MKKNKEKKVREKFANHSNQRSLSIAEMLVWLATLTDGWPKIVSGMLCYQSVDKLRSLCSAKALFAWIDKVAKVDWRRGVTKDEFFEGLLQQAEEYDWSSPFPHFPPIPGVYYTCKVPNAENNGSDPEKW
jgi:hypothetical protein